MFQNPTCNPEDVCYESFLNTKPDLDLLIFISDNSKSNSQTLILKLEKFDYLTSFQRDVTIKLSENVRHNGSIVVHSILLPSKVRNNNIILRELNRFPDVTYVKSLLTKYAIPYGMAINLLKQEDKRKLSAKPVTHIRSKYALIMCTDYLEIPHKAIPYEIARHMRIRPKNEFLPILKRDAMQMRIKDLVEVLPQMETFNVTFIYNPVSYGKLRFLLQVEASLEQFISLGFSDKDLDEVKNVFADTNLYLLCMAIFVGGVHLLLDFLSFKNDVSFWKGQKTMAGLSSRTVLWRAFSQTIVFLYLLDEGTSLLVLIPSGIGTVIEFWKVSKVFKVSWSGGLSFKKNHKETEEERKTKEYDDECMKYLCYLLYPLCAGAAIYSLLYQPHKSWYSWTISSLVNAVYGFGFLFMLPQLFINYRLKSVAALPWRAFTYKAFNTFIDDIFAFIITMPTAHRLACFRDDIVFLLYLYQRWLYPVDKSRKDDLALGEEEPKTENKKNQ